MATVSIMCPCRAINDVDALQRLADALAEPRDLDVVSDVAVRRRLPRPDEGVVLRR